MKSLPLVIWHDFFSELHWLLKHGIHLQAGLTLLSHQRRLKPLLAFLSHCLLITSRGQPFSDAFHLPQCRRFRPFILAGEMAGALDTALGQCTAYLAQRIQLHAQCRALAFYPCLLLLVLLAGSFLLLSIIVPQFYSLYQALNAPIPAGMETLWTISNFFSHNNLLLGTICGSGLGIGYLLFQFIPRYRLLLERFWIALPAVRLSIHAQECHYLGMLISSGIPIAEALRHLIFYNTSKKYLTVLHHIYDHLMQGASLTQAYRSAHWHDAYFCDMLTIAEETGTLDTAYLKLAAYYTECLERLVTQFKHQWQPLILLGMGVFVGSWVVLLYYPLMQLGYAL